MSSKKYLIVLILKILESHTDSFHPLTQKEIANQILPVYPCDRKTVGRNIKFLKELGYPIVKTGKGFYMDKLLFSIDEINYVIDAIKGSPERDEIDKSILVEKVTKQLNRYKVYK